MLYRLLDRVIKTTERTKTYENEDYRIYWEGLLFIKGLAPGSESFDELTEKLKFKSLENLCYILSGLYACIVHDKKKDTIYTFSDNIGIFNLYHSNTYISTSYLDLLKNNQYNKNDIDPITMTDFILTGSCMQWKTLFKDAKKTKYDEIIVDNGSEIKVIKKNLIDIFSINKYDNKSIIKLFEPIALSLKKLKGRISLDLTAGRDTRIISVLLKYYNVDFETSSVGYPGNPDVVVAEKIAEKLGVEHHSIYETAESRNIQKEIDEAFIQFDGLTDIIIWHAYYQFQKEKYRRNCVLTVSGHAGEFYKPYDFMWDVDNKDPIKTINQLLNLKLNIRYGLGRDDISHAFFSEEYKKYADSYKERLKKFLIENFGNDKSGKAGPKIYAYFMEGSRTTNMGPFIDRYSPLLDRELIPCGTTLKYPTNTLKIKLKRIFNHPWDDRESFDHRVLTFVNKKVAKIPTDLYYGVSYSTQTSEQIKDIIRQRLGNLKKAHERKIVRRNPNLYPMVKSLNKTEELIELLKNENLLKNDVKLENIDDSYLGGLITIGKLIEFLS